MRLIAFGAEATGVIAIGQVSTGVVAIGQLATGVIAIGQLSRGVIAIGQLSLGIVAAGQLSAGVAWAGGIGVGATAGPGLVFGLAGRLRMRPHVQFQRARVHGMPAALFRVVVGLVLAAVVWFLAIEPLVHDLTRVGGVFRAPPHVLR